MIEIRQLRYFLAIAEEQSITRATEYLRMSQLALSKQMIDLKGRLGKQLIQIGEIRAIIVNVIEELRDHHKSTVLDSFASLVLYTAGHQMTNTDLRMINDNF